MKKYFSFVFILFVIVFLATGTKERPTSDDMTESLVTIKCKNTNIPHFTLDYDADPSEEEKVKLCSCIWDKLDGWEKETAIKLTTGKKEEISSVHRAAFPAVFGTRISECGGEKL